MAQVTESKLSKEKKRMKEAAAERKINRSFATTSAPDKWKLVYALLQQAGFNIDP